MAQGPPARVVRRPPAALVAFSNSEPTHRDDVDLTCPYDRESRGDEVNRRKEMAWALAR